MNTELTRLGNILVRLVTLRFNEVITMEVTWLLNFIGIMPLITNVKFHFWVWFGHNLM